MYTNVGDNLAVIVSHAATQSSHSVTETLVYTIGRIELFIDKGSTHLGVYDRDKFYTDEICMNDDAM